MAADSFLWSTNVVAVTSCENFIEDPTRLPYHHVQTSNCILPGFMKTGLGINLKFKISSFSVLACLYLASFLGCFMVRE